MSFPIHKFLSAFMNIFLLSCINAGTAWADTSQKLKPLIDTVEQVKEGMTLWELIRAGGILMIPLFAISLLTIALVIFNYLTIDEKKVAPAKFAEDAIDRLEEGALDELKTMCAQQPNIFANIILAGLEKTKRGPVFAKEAMEHTARKEMATIWQNVNYLSDIVTIAPLIGLLGTVLGMIQAFNVVAFQVGVVKPILLAGGVAKAMVTTAAGLFIAIPASIFYAYFKTKIQQITHTVENYTQDMIKIFDGLNTSVRK